MHVDMHFFFSMSSVYMLCVHMCVSVCVCVHVCEWVCIYRVCMSVREWKRERAQACLCTCAYVCMCQSTHKWARERGRERERERKRKRKRGGGGSRSTCACQTSKSRTAGKHSLEVRRHTRSHRAGPLQISLSLCILKKWREKTQRHYQKEPKNQHNREHVTAVHTSMSVKS